MKNKFNWLIIFLAFSSNLYADSTMSVQIKEAKLRAKPQHWAPAIETLRYGDNISKIKEESGWTQASSKTKKTGFIQSSALSSSKIVLSTAGTVNTKADMGEVVLAGKGFSKSTEDQFAKNNAETNFAAVNKLEQIKISDSEMQKFAAAGKLAQELK